MPSDSPRNIVDLRSDTVTRPTPEMYEAILNAEVGDDVMGGDPTVNRLEALAAEMTGKDAAVFVPSGTMGNQMAVATHCRPGDAIIIEEDAHILYYEVGSPGAIAGVVSWTLRSKHGAMDPADVERHILKRNLHNPGTALICLESSHNRAGGTIIPLDMMSDYQRIGEKHGVKVHLDGARVFNAAVALGIPVREITKHVDTVNFCLSKGLRSPVGSLLCGPSAFIEEARFWRKRMGGGMRQAGILAACGIVSLTKMVDRLEEDHRRIRVIANALAEMPGVTVNWDTVQTNILIFKTDAPALDWVSRLEAHGVLSLPYSDNTVRIVMHADIDEEMVAKAIEAFGAVATVLSTVQ